MEEDFYYDSVGYNISPIQLKPQKECSIERWFLICLIFLLFYVNVRSGNPDNWTAQMLSNLCPEINAKGISTILVTENRFELFRKPVIFMEDVCHRLASSAGDNKKPSIAAYSAVVRILQVIKDDSSSQSNNV